MYVIADTAYIPQIEIKRRQLIMAADKVFTYNEANKMISISFKNVGDVDATINQMELKAPTATTTSVMRSYTGEKFIVDTSDWQLVFDKASAGTNPKVEVEVVMQHSVKVLTVNIPNVERT